MYSRILVPLDGSELAEQVLPYVRLIAQRMQSPIDLIRTFSLSIPELHDPVHAHYLEQITSSFPAQAEAYLEKVKTTLQDLGVPVSSIVQEGEPPLHIVSEAKKKPDTLVAMSTHGRSGISRWVLGSVMDRVLHGTTNPLLVVRARSDGTAAQDVRLKTMTVPLDGSPTAEQVLPHVVDLAKALDLKVMLVRVVSTSQVFGEYVTFQHEDFSQYLAAEATNYLRNLRPRLRSQGVSSVEERLLHGHPATALVDLANETPDNLVAMTTHGRSGIRRWILGSVTDKIVRHSGDPVLVVPSVAESP